MNGLANYLVAVLLEDRVDDLIKQYPDKKFSRDQLATWQAIDPSRNQKYFAWIVKQIARNKFNPKKDGEKMHDDLMAFERFLAIPEFRESRDIQAYDYKTLHKTIQRYSGLQSKSQKEREARSKGATVVASLSHGGKSYELVKITNTQELMNRAWTAYATTNPNWKGKKLNAPVIGQEDAEEWDGLWCVRFPRYAASYLSEGPFYLVYRNGGPYVGIVWEKGECQTLENQGISLGMAEEIYPLVKDTIPAMLEGRCSIFANLRFLRGEAKDGEVVDLGHNQTLNLSGSSLRKLPSRLTVRGSLDISGTPIRELPPGLTVSKLMIQGTGITSLPLDLTTAEMEWSEPLTYEEVVRLYFRNKLGEMKRHFWDQKKNAALSDEDREAAWMRFQPALQNHFLKSEEVGVNIRVIYRHVGKH